MSKVLGKLFIKDYKNLKNEKVRSAYGVLGSCIGLISNCFLSAIKIVIGVLTSSIAIVADGINNLSDTASSVVSLVGFKLSRRPADEGHPFGHARIEYISSLIISFIIIVVGFELIVNSVSKINNKSVTTFNYLTFIVLGISIFIKFYLFFYYKIWGKKINSTSLKAISFDSFNDVIATSVILLCALISKFTKINLDAYAGICVALFIIYSGIKLMNETLSPLLGEKPDKTLVTAIFSKMKSYDNILGVHDLVVHNYGPNRYFATLHAEVDAKVDILTSHELIDTIERELTCDNLKVVIHLDPINTDDEITKTLKLMVEKVIYEINEQLTMHDFRVVVGPNRKNLIFDIVVPTKENINLTSLDNLINLKIKEIDISCCAVINFDLNYIDLTL